VLHCSVGWSPNIFTVEPGALKTFAAESVAPNIKIRAFLRRVLCCLLEVFAVVVLNKNSVQVLGFIGQTVV